MKSKPENKRPEPRRRLKDPEHERKPSLRISHIVYGRSKKGPKVVYLVDPKGSGTEKAVAESVVLYRWRRRKFDGYAFSGTRLYPKIWRTLPKVFGPNPNLWKELSEAELKSVIESKRELMREQFETLPAVNCLRALFEVCGTNRLQKLIDRHNDPERQKRFGTPDLFLYAIEKQSGKATIARFVEVKKPEETVKPDQHEEIEFLQSLGLHARVLRLDERT